MAKEFLRTLCTKYLCDELCHKKRNRGKRVTQNSSAKTPRAKARGRGCPWVVPPLRLTAAALFLGGSSYTVLSQDVRSCADIFSLVLDLVCTLGRDRRGVGPWPLPRIPTSSSSSLLPIPLHGLLLRSYGGGWGGKDDPFDWVVKGLVVPCPCPKGNCDSDGKGAMVFKTMRPVFNFALHVQNCMQQAERQSLEGEAERKRTNPNQKRQNQKAKAKRGF